MSDKYHTVEKQILCVLDSRNGISDNGSNNSIVKFYFEDPIQLEFNSIHMSCSVLSFTCPNSIYNINETNNLLSLTDIRGKKDYMIPYGNYTSQTFMIELINQIGSNYNISMNNITNIFTLNSINDFTINESTIYQVMGFVQESIYTSINKSIIFPFTCNFNGLQSINIEVQNFNTSNIDSITKSNSSVIQSIPIDNTLQQIIFAKTNSFQFIINQDVISFLQIELRDDVQNLVNLNNQHWNLTLCFTELQNINRFAYMKDFNYIMKNGYFEH
jgi:hypothetical protein